MKTYREKFIEKISRIELDLEHPRYTGDDKNEVIIPYEDIVFAEAPSINIDELIELLEELKQKGSNRVYIAQHCDHHGYYFYGVKLSRIGNKITY